MFFSFLFSLQELSDRVFYSAREIPGSTGKLFLKVTRGFQIVLQWWSLSVWNWVVEYPVSLFYLVTLQPRTTKSSRVVHQTHNGHLRQQSSGKDGQGELVGFSCGSSHLDATLQTCTGVMLTFRSTCTHEWFCTTEKKGLAHILRTMQLKCCCSLAHNCTHTSILHTTLPYATIGYQQCLLYSHTYFMLRCQQFLLYRRTYFMLPCQHVLGTCAHTYCYAAKAFSGTCTRKSIHPCTALCYETNPLV